MDFRENESLIDFPCQQCGACCKQVNLSAQTAFLDRGDGICLHLDLKSSLCKIYNERPEVCNVQKYYEKYLSDQYTWPDFIEINLIACKQLYESEQL